jgi:hypothetical protein
MSDMIPMTILDKSVHYDKHGACITFTSSDEKIEWLRKDAAKHGHHLAWGKCAEAPVRCEENHGYKICASKEGVDVSDMIELDSIHGMYRGRCYDASGSKADIEHLRRVAPSHGVTPHDGKCADAHDCM